MLVKIKDFASRHNVQYGTVNQYINRNPSIKAACVKSEGLYAIDTESVAYRKLCEKYPEPEEVAIIKKDPADEKRIQDLEEQTQLLTKMLTGMREENIQLQARVTQLLGDAEQVHLLQQEADSTRTMNATLQTENEEKTRYIDTLRNDVADRERKIDTMTEDIRTAQEQRVAVQEELERTKADLDRLRHRNLLQRIFNKD